MAATTITINDVEPRRQYTATAGQTVFDFPLPFFEQGDLTVWLTPNGNSPDDTNDLLTITSDYTVSGADTQDGGTVTLVTPATAGDIVTIERIVDLERLTDFQVAGDLLAETLNKEQDVEIMALQQLRTDIDRSIKRAITSSSTADLTLPEPLAGAGIGWNGAGTALENVNPVQPTTSNEIYTTVALMKLQSLDDGLLVETKGYTSAGDGGAGRYLVKTAAQATADGDTIDEVGAGFTLANGNVAILQPVFNKVYLAQFGVADDGTDQYAKINAAFTYADSLGGGTIISIAGTAKYATQLLLPSNCTLQGVGRYISILEPIGDINGIQIQRDSTLENIWLKTNQAQTAGRWVVGFGFLDTAQGGVAMDNARSIIRNVEIGRQGITDTGTYTSLADGIRGTNSFLGKIDHVRVTRCNIGLFMTNAFNATEVTSFEAVRNVWGGAVEGLNGVDFNMCTWEGNQRVGLLQGFSKACTHVQPYFEANHTTDDSDATAKFEWMIGAGSVINPEFTAAGLTSTDPGGGVRVAGVSYFGKGGASFSEGCVKVSRQRNCILGPIFAASFAGTDEILHVTNEANTTGWYEGQFSNPTMVTTILAENFGTNITSVNHGKAVPIVYTSLATTASLAPAASAAVATLESGGVYLATATQSGGAAGFRACYVCFAHSNNTIVATPIDNALSSFVDLGSLSLGIQNDHGASSAAFDVHILKIGQI